MRNNRAALKAKLSQKDVAALYDKVSGIYDLWAHLTESRARKRSLQLAKVEDGQRILEVAVGTGLAFIEVVGQNPNGRNLGIDLSEGMLARARHRLRNAGHSNYELRIGSALDIEAADSSFDTLLNSYMFDLLEESAWARVLSEFRRVLKPTGRLILVNMTFGERWGSGIYEKLYRLSPSLMGGCRGVQLIGPLELQGFEIRRREYVQQMLFPSEVILAANTRCP